MKLTLNLFLALAMVLSLAFFSEFTSSGNALSVQAQTRRGQVVVKKKSRPGIARSVARGAKYIYRKGKNGTIYIYRKTAKGTVYVGKKTVQGTKYVGKKTYKTGRKVVSRTKKIIY